ncbi:MAG: hypothetical protein K6F21_05745 [Bacteroidales bacterium]|nr:hypothetical protein [Bacteroidales bacterium]
MKKTSLTIVFLLLCAINLQAFYPRVKHYPRQVHGGGTQTWAITQSKEGIIYFANNDGLLEYDGNRWSLYSLRNYTSVRSLYYDEDKNKIWAGGTNELGWFSPGTDGMQYHPILDSLGITVSEIWKIGRDGNGYIYFEDKSDRYILAPEAVRKEALSPEIGSNIRLSAENDRYKVEGTDSEGAFITSLADGNSIHLDISNGLQNNTVLSACFDSSGDLWLGLDSGIDCVRLGSPIFRMFGNPLKFGTGYAAEEFEEDIYIGTNTGLFHVPASKLAVSVEDKDFEQVAGISGQVWSLLKIDDELLCCHDRGVFVIKSGRVRYHIPLQGAWKLERLQEDPSILLGCSYSEPFILERKGGRWHFARTLQGLGLASKTFEQDYDGSIWFAHHVQGLYRFHIDQDYGKVVELRHYGTEDGFPSENNNYPFRYRNGLLFTTEEGFYQFDESSGKARPFDEINSLFDRSIHYVNMYETPDRMIRLFSSGDNLQAIEYNSADGRRVLDSFSLKSLQRSRPLGFECYIALAPGLVAVNDENGFSIISVDRLSMQNGDQTGKLIIKDITNIPDGRTLYFSRTGGDASSGRKFKHNENSLRFSFALPDYSDDAVVNYSCWMEGFDKSYTPPSTADYKEYPRLPHGKYTFHVKAVNPLLGHTQESKISFRIATPWYASILAKLIYIALFICILYALQEWIRSYYRRKAEKAQMRHEIERKAEDLAGSTMNVMRKNELLGQIESEVDKSIEGIKNGEDRDQQLKRLRKLTQLIESNIVHDDDWKTFQNNFDVVYSDFLKRLGNKYPKLSMSDKKICAYLRMDLSSKAIAPLMGMSVHSVETSRYRLRKKLELNKEDNLTDFLQKF